MKNPIGFLYKTTLLGFLSSVFICFKLWHNSRTFPTIPVFSFLPSLTVPLNFVLLGLLIALLIAALFVNRPGLFIPVILGLTGLLVLEDINRLQPEFYIFSMLLFLVYLHACNKVEEEKLFLIFRILISAIYIFTGLNKINACFFINVYGPMINKLQGVLPAPGYSLLSSLSFLIPAMEIGTGIAIWIPKLKKISFFLAAAFHLSILMMLGPLVLNSNYSVFPWNICMVVFVFVLYKHQTGYGLLKSMKDNRYVQAALVLFVLVPSSHFLNLAGSFVSFDVYSGKYGYTYVFIPEDMYPKLPEYIKHYAIKNDNEHGDYRVYLDDWAGGEIKAPIFYDDWVLRRFRSYFSRYASEVSVEVVVMRNNEEKLLQ